MRVVALPKGWAFDTSAKLTRASARSMLISPFAGCQRTPASAPRVALIRYLSLGTPSMGDLDIPERDAIFDAGWPAIGLVQHVNLPSWIADSRNGTTHGQAAARHAQLIEAAPGTDITPDIEGLGSNGATAYDYLCYWADAVRYLGLGVDQITQDVVDHPPGYGVRPYDGYDDGLPDVYKSLLLTRGIVAANKWWSDYGPRELPPPEQFSMKQHTQITLGGVPADPDEVLIDGVIMCMARDLSTGEVTS